MWGRLEGLEGGQHHNIGDRNHHLKDIDSGINSALNAGLLVFFLCRDTDRIRVSPILLQEGNRDHHDSLGMVVFP